LSRIPSDLEAVRWVFRYVASIIRMSVSTDPEASLRYRISFVMYELADDTTVKVEDYPGDVKDISDPEKYIADLEEEYGQEVPGYYVKAGQQYVDQDGTVFQEGTDTGLHKIGSTATTSDRKSPERASKSVSRSAGTGNRSQRENRSPKGGRAGARGGG